MTPSAVVFDCDGVLVDSEPHSIAAWLDVLGRIHHPATASDIQACTGLGFGPTHQALSAVSPLPAPDLVWPELLAALDRSFRRGLVVFPDAVAVLEACAAGGLPIAVASASPRARLDLTLATAGLGGRFAVSVAGDEVARGKPAPDVYLAASARLEVDPTTCVAVEDTPAGVTAAIAAGMRVIAVIRLGADPVALVAAGAVVVDALTSASVGL
ncbi:MAG TPA: HAD family phosphatase [Acidimicrobiia bacterium]|nr:HAD family phosphatase [Acidimicrobiia bacterium]